VAESGDANFTQAEGSGSPLELADQTTPATSLQAVGIENL